MTIFKTAYDTTACEGYGQSVKKIQQALEEVSALSALSDTHRVFSTAGEKAAADLLDTSSIQTHGLLGMGWSDRVPAFAHPLHFVYQQDELIAVDSRPFTRYDVSSGSYRFGSQTEAFLMSYRACLQKLWDTPKRDLLENFHNLPMRVYAGWLADLIAHRYGLDPKGRMVCQVLAAVHYLSCWVDHDVKEWRDEDRQLMSLTMMRSLRLNVDDTNEILSQLEGPIHGVRELVVRMKALVGSVRLNEFNHGVLHTIVGGSWFSANAREIMAVSLEHPPTWIAVLISAIQERGYKNSGIAKLIERSFSRDAQPFLRSALAVVDSI